MEVEHAKRIVELEAEFDKLEWQNSNLKEQVTEWRDREERTKGKKDAMTEKFWAAETGKRKLEIDLKEAARRLEDGVAEAGRLRGLLEEKEAARSELEGKVSYFVEKVEALEKEKGERDDELCMLRREAESRRVAEERVSELVQKIGVLEKDKGDRDAEILELKSGLDMDCWVRKVDDQRAEEKMSELVEKIEALEKEKGDRDGEICKLRSTLEMGDHGNIAREATCRRVEERILELVQEINVLKKDKAEKIEALEEKISEFLEKVQVLEKEVKDKGAKICKLEMDKSIAEERVVEVEKKITGEKRKEIHEIKERGSFYFAGMMKAVESEKRAMEDDHKEKILELNQSIEVLEEEKREMVARLDQEKLNNTEEMRRILSEKRAMEDENEKNGLELARRIEDLEKEKTALEERHENEVLEFVSRVDVLEKEKQGLETETRKKDGVIMDLEKERQENKVSDLVSRARVLEKEKHGLEAETMKKYEVIKVLEKEKMTLKERHAKLVSRVDILEEEKCGLETDTRKKDGEIKALEKENTTLKEKHAENVLELVSRVNVLEKEKRGLGLKARNIEGVIKELEKEKMTLKEMHANEVLEFVSRVNVLEREKQGLDAITKKKDVLAKALVQHNDCVTAEKHMLETETSDCISEKSVEDLEEPQQAHPMNNVANLGQKFSHVSIKETQKGSSYVVATELKGHSGQTSGSNMVCNAKEVLIAAKPKDSDNIQISKGRRSTNGCTTKEVGNLSHEGIECTPPVPSQTIAGSPRNSIVPQKRKLETVKCSLVKQIGTEQLKSRGSQSNSGTTYTPPFASQSNPTRNVANIDPKYFKVRKLEDLGSSVKKRVQTKKCKQKWETALEMRDAFTINDELCVRSVCALYRKHKSLGCWKNYSSSSSTTFKPVHVPMGMALGELLTNGDPQGRMKDSVCKFRRTHPVDLEECRLIAGYHHMELFEIYKSNLDPLFMA